MKNSDAVRWTDLRQHPGRIVLVLLLGSNQKQLYAARFVPAKTQRLGFVFLPSYEDREAQGILHGGRIARGQIPVPKLFASICFPDDMILPVSWADLNATTF